LFSFLDGQFDDEASYGNPVSDDNYGDDVEVVSRVKVVGGGGGQELNRRKPTTVNPYPRRRKPPPPPVRPIKRGQVKQPRGPGQPRPRAGASRPRQR